MTAWRSARNDGLRRDVKAALTPVLLPICDLTYISLLNFNVHGIERSTEPYHYPKSEGQSLMSSLKVQI